jgi:hypothetical protein
MITPPGHKVLFLEYRERRGGPRVGVVVTVVEVRYAYRGRVVITDDLGDQQAIVLVPLSRAR